MVAVIGYPSVLEHEGGSAIFDDERVLVSEPFLKDFDFRPGLTRDNHAGNLAAIQARQRGLRGLFSPHTEAVEPTCDPRTPFGRDWNWVSVNSPPASCTEFAYPFLPGTILETMPPITVGSCSLARRSSV
jgi:hypothetical protein